MYKYTCYSTHIFLGTSSDGSDLEDVHVEVANLESLKASDMLLIGADANPVYRQKTVLNPRLGWKSCRYSTGSIKRNLKELGRLDHVITSRAYRYLDSQQRSLVIGSHGVQIGRAKTYKDKLEEPLKQSFLDSWENQPDLREPRELENYWGVVVSLCTGSARPVRFVDILGYDSVTKLLERFLWGDREQTQNPNNGSETLQKSPGIRREAYLEAVSSADPSALGNLWDEHPDWQEDLGKAILICLRVLARTGYDENRDEFHVLWYPPECRGARRITFKPKEQQWVQFLRDTTLSMTVAVAVKDYLGHEGHCTQTNGQWDRKTSILETAICVNRKLDPAFKLKKVRGCRDEHNWLHRADSKNWRYIWDASEIDKGEHFRMDTQVRVKTVQTLNQWHLLLDMDTVKRMLLREVVGMRPSEDPGHWEYTDEHGQSRKYRPVPVHITA